MSRGFIRDCGFSLIELSLILLMIALFMAGYHAVYKDDAVTEKQSKVTTDLNRVRASLEIYARAFGRYPCPADPTVPNGDPNFGHNAANIDGSGNCASGYPGILESADPDTVTNNHDDDIVVMGMLPVRDLSIGFTDAYDAWGNRLGYAVTRGLTRSLAAAGSIRILSEHSNGGNVTNEPAIITNAAWALISFGADGIGAYPNNGGTRITSASQGGTAVVDSEHQNINHHLYANFDNIFLSSSSTADPSIQYDDQLIWGAKIRPCRNFAFTDNTNNNPSTISSANLKLWLDSAEANSLINNSGTVVPDGRFYTWCDKSGGSLSNNSQPAFSYGTSFNSRPIIGVDARHATAATAPSGKRVVRFDNIDDSIADGMFIDDVFNISDTAENYTAFIVGRYHNTPQARSLGSRDSADWWLGLNAGNQGFQGGATATPASTAGTTWFISDVVKNGSLARYYGNGVELPASGGVPTNIAPGRLGLGSGATASASMVDISEIVVYRKSDPSSPDNLTAILSDADRYKIEDYLSDKWGICMGGETYIDDPASTTTPKAKKCLCSDGTNAAAPARSCIPPIPPGQVWNGSCLVVQCPVGAVCNTGCWGPYGSTTARVCGCGQTCGSSTECHNLSYPYLRRVCTTRYFCSDARLKEFITTVGNQNGFNIYEFSYKPTVGIEGRFRGVMAQEVEKIMPEAVITMETGYKAVNYQMLGMPFERIE